MYCERCGLLLTPDTTVCPNCATPPRPAGVQGAAPAAAAASGPHARPGRSAAAAMRQRFDGPVPWRALGGWIRHALGGNAVNLVVAFTCAWGTLPMAILTAGLGAVLGGVAGAFSGSILEDPVMSRLDWLLVYLLPIPWGDQPAIGEAVLLGVNDLVPSLGWQTGGILGGVLGAAAGGLILGWHGLTFSWALMWDNDPTTPVSNLLGAAVAAALIGAVYTVVAAAGERWIAQVSGARTPTRAEAAAASALVAQVCRTRMGVAAARVRILVRDDATPAASPGLRHLTVTTGLLDTEPARAEVIVAHALALGAAGAPVARAFADGVALPMIGLYEIARRVLEGVRVRPIAFALRLVLWPLLVTGRWVAAPPRRWWWRRRIFAADAAVAALGMAGELAAWLETTPARPRPRGRGWWAMTAVDPARAHRLDRLNHGGPPPPPPAPGGPPAAGLSGPATPSTTDTEGVAV